jgi:hypothetical protein
MLKITLEEKPTVVTIRLEGRIAGPWVAELQKVWHSVRPSLDSKTLEIDLRDVVFIDADGRRLVNEIHKATGVQFQTNSLMIDSLIRKATQE